MSRFSQLLTKMYKLESEISIVSNKLSEIIENKLGDGWCIVQQTDGICLLDEHYNNYCLPFDELVKAMLLEKNEALNIIKKYGL